VSRLEKDELVLAIRGDALVRQLPVRRERNLDTGQLRYPGIVRPIERLRRDRHGSPGEANHRHQHEHSKDRLNPIHASSVLHSLHSMEPPGATIQTARAPIWFLPSIPAVA